MGYPRLLGGGGIAVKRLIGLLVVTICLRGTLGAEDWPEWRGRGRGGVWNESGILERFPEKGLTAAWRTPLRAGYAGPAVADGRVFVTDFERSAGMKGKERALCLEERSGKVLWTREWDVDYGSMSYPNGPRATPTVDGDRVYVVGASGILLCLDARTGNVVWRKDYVKDYGTQIPTWGIASAPLVDGERLIVIAGGQPDAKVMALDKGTGREIWRALPSDSQPGYAQPVIVEAAGARRLIIWHPKAVASLDPVTGQVHWQQPFSINMGMTLATPVVSGNRLLVSSFFNGSMLLDLLGKSDLEGQERQRDRHRRSARRDQHPGDRRRVHLRHLQLRAVPVPEPEDRRAGVGKHGGHEGEGPLGIRVHREERRPLLHQHRPGRPGHREAVPARAMRRSAARPSSSPPPTPATAASSAP